LFLVGKGLIRKAVIGGAGGGGGGGEFLWYRVLLCGPDWSQQLILLSQPPKCWDYRCAPPYLAILCFLLAVWPWTSHSPLWDFFLSPFWNEIVLRVSSRVCRLPGIW
jgi:hypothetical protein